jgi:hypothetical protein
MNRVLLTWIILLFFTKQNDSRFDLLCQKWRWVGSKDFGKEYKPVNETSSEVIFLKKDGTYEEELYGSIQIKGIWNLCCDSSKIGFVVVEMNGAKMGESTFNGLKPTDSIMKLTKDTLIYAALAYFGEKKIYGHDDWYFVREK